MQKLQRQSNFELLRILAMFMVLALHANELSNGMPDYAELMGSPTYSSFRVMAQVFCTVAIDVFVGISAWFGLKFNWKNLANILFQCIFYAITIIAFFCFFDKSQLTLQFLSHEIFIGGGYWFVPSYIMLMIISPVLNIYVEQTPRVMQKKVLVAFFVFQFFYGWLPTDNRLFCNGFHTLSFIGLYLLVRYIRIFSPRITRFDPKVYVYSYICSCLVVGGVYLSAILLNNESIMGGVKQRFILSYNNPLIITGSISLLLTFSKLKCIGTNKYINWLAQSCFAIYLIHDHPLVWKYYVNHMHHIHITYNSFSAIPFIFISILVVGMVCILIDKIRLFVWKRLINSYNIFT